MCALVVSTQKIILTNIEILSFIKIFYMLVRK